MERIELERLLEATGCAEPYGGFCFLVDPYWTDVQRAIYSEIRQSEIPDSKSNIKQGWLCIPTGGSSGTLRFARHDEKTLGAAVRGFCTHFDLARVNAVDVLPPWHVSGLLARIRCAMTGGEYVSWAWKRLEGGSFPVLADNKPWLLSLVPTQLQRLLEQPATVAWMRQLSLVIIGGGPIWPDLAEAARGAKLRLVVSYGMTETAAMIASQTVSEFADGDRSCGHALPHARIQINADSSTAPSENETGIICVSGDSVMRGYYPGIKSVAKFKTADLGRFDSGDRLHIVGRRDGIVITGGEKVNPREVEAALRAAGKFRDVAVVAVPHHEWGEELVVGYVAEQAIDQSEIDALVRDLNLTRHQRPKRFLAIPASDWPRNTQGKLNRAVLRQAILAR